MQLPAKFVVDGEVLVREGGYKSFINRKAKSTGCCFRANPSVGLNKCQSDVWACTGLHD